MYIKHSKEPKRKVKFEDYRCDNLKAEGEVVDISNWNQDCHKLHKADANIEEMTIIIISIQLVRNYDLIWLEN